MFEGKSFVANRHNRMPTQQGKYSLRSVEAVSWEVVMLQTAEKTACRLRLKYSNQKESGEDRADPNFHQS
jgi:metal-dependent HD superfamily phosphatase/phosphodiesterase